MTRLIVLLAALLLALPALAQSRHALVVGIDAYAEVTPLQKARNDAVAVAAALEQAGFRVETLLDPDRRALLAGLAGFSQRLQPGDEAAFFFAGHGVEVAGRNVLLAADVPGLRPGDEMMLDSEGLPVDRVLSAILDRGARAAVLIIDACRDNPFPRAGTRSLGATRGLARLDPPAGAMVVFSAGTGQAALDRLSDNDPNPNSVFTRALLPLLSEPGLALHEAARRLRIEVEDLAATIRHDQRPAIYDEMRGDFVLIPAAATAAVTPAIAAPQQTDPCAAALPVWSAIQNSDSQTALESFAAGYGATCPVLAALARERLAGLAQAAAATEPAWSRATYVTLSGHTEPITDSAISPDGMRIVTASNDNTARIWDAATGRSIATLSGHTDRVESAAFSPDGRRIVTASRDNTARIWNAESGRLITTLRGHTFWISRAAFSSDGRHIVTASWDHTARTWDAGTGSQVATLRGHTFLVNAAVFSPDGRQVATASGDNTARIWDAGTGRAIATLSGHTYPVATAAFSPDGRQIVTASEDTTARIWDAETGRALATLRGHTDWVWTAAFSPNGQRIVTASVDSTARIWDAETGRAIATLRGHTARVDSVAFSPDGRHVVTGSMDDTARIWDAETGRAIATLSGHRDRVWVAAFSPDGRRIVTASADNTARIWTAP